MNNSIPKFFLNKLKVNNIFYLASKRDFTNKFRELMTPLYEMEGMRSFGYFVKSFPIKIMTIKGILLQYVPTNDSFENRLKAAIRSSITDKHLKIKEK